MKIFTQQNSLTALLMGVTCGLSAAQTTGEGDSDIAFDTLRRYELPAVDIVQSTKNMLSIEQILSPVSSITTSQIEQQGLRNPRALSSIVPNLHIPDYGSAMTSTIYMRGFGSRIDNPVIGLYVDDVPIIDKNNYDFDMFDIYRADIYRGPQSTLYGRNSMLGVMAITTLSPTNAEGGTANLEYGKAGSVIARTSYYDKHFGISLGYRHSDGFFRNQYDDKNVDKYDALSLRTKYAADLTRRLSMENTLSLSLLKQGGYAYQQSIDGNLMPIDYNDTCRYQRFSLVDGLKLSLKTDRLRLSSVTSVQWLADKMQLDQDFTSVDMFAMAQEQHQYALTEELVLRPERHPSWWNHQTGVFFMHKYNSMHAPVEMREAALKSLILDQINNIYMANAPVEIAFSESVLPIRDDFKLGNQNAALYHESYLTFGNWQLTGGLRLDYERNSMDYDCAGGLHYYAILRAMGRPITEPKLVETLYQGSLQKHYWQLLPKFSAAYRVVDTDRTTLRLIANVSKGFKAGGYNTQIFSDILRNMLQADMMADAGHGSDEEQVITSQSTTYKPETCVNYEIGAHFDQRGEASLFRLSLTGFLVNSNDLQLTVMPDAESTGRVMTNAGKARSVGLEADMSYSISGYTLSAAFGYSNSYFRQYQDGHNDYRNMKVPYAPQNTLSVRASKQVYVGQDLFTFGIDGRETGKIWWNESNSLHQAPYFLLGADLSYTRGGLTLYARADNITATKYRTFYFSSVGNEFYQRGKPFQWGVGCTYKF